MAEIETVRALRLLVAEPDDTTYSDAQLGAIIDATSSTDEAAHVVWVQKMAEFAHLVDISEGGSQRKNSQLYAQAKEMAAFFAESVATANGRPTIRKLVRG